MKRKPRKFPLLLPLLALIVSALFCADERIRKACFEGNCKDGKGVLVYYQIIYKGTFKDSKMSGQGTMQWAEGKVYKGQWENGKPSGQGSMRFKDGRHYEGEWKRGRYHGKGMLQYPDGRVYTGDFVNGKMHGQGVMTYGDGHKLQGRFKNDIFDP